MNHVYGNGEVPPENYYKQYTDTVIVEPFYGDINVVLDVTVEVQYADCDLDEPVDAVVTDVKWNGHTINTLALALIDEDVLIEKVMGLNFMRMVRW